MRERDRGREIKREMRREKKRLLSIASCIATSIVSCYLSSECNEMASVIKAYTNNGPIHPIGVSVRAENIQYF